LNILPKEIADELKNTGQATPRYFEDVSILFVDITKFSMMVRRMSTNDLVKDLDYIFSAFDDISLKYHLEKIKTIGDAYMCVGGLPIPNKTHASDTVNAGIEMLAFIEEYKKTKHALSGDGLNLRVGIHTGPVTAGVVGKSKFQFDIWGDSVNLASRMETNSEPGKINISSTTFEQVKEHFTCEFRGKFQVKNMGKVDMYFVVDSMLEIPES
jgi:class 3 adenylate cyclase